MMDGQATATGSDRSRLVDVPSNIEGLEKRVINIRHLLMDLEKTLIGEPPPQESMGKIGREYGDSLTGRCLANIDQVDRELTQVQCLCEKLSNHCGSTTK